MDIALFLLGALGALLTVYLAKDEVIPEFRPLFDTLEKETEAAAHREHIKQTEQEIDKTQAELKQKTLPADYGQRLQKVLDSSLAELQAERSRLQLLEREIKQQTFLSRSMGFFFYILLGGVFGSLLAGRVEVEGLSGDLPDFFKSIIIGATWTSYLSTIGIKSVRKKADERIETGLKKSAEKIEAVKKEITETVANEMGKAETREKTPHPVQAEAVANMVAQKLDLAAAALKKDMNITRLMVQRDVKGVL